MYFKKEQQESLKKATAEVATEMNLTSQKDKDRELLMEFAEWHYNKFHSGSLEQHVTYFLTQKYKQ